MQNLRCREREDVHKHFDTLRDMREQLASMDQAPTDESFTTIIISSLPSSYQAQIGAVMALSKVTGTAITSDVLMATVLDVYDSRNVGTRKSTNESGEDAAYATSGDSKQWRIHGDCYNCGKYGHMARDCRANKEKAAKEKDEVSDSKGKGREKASEKAAIADESSGMVSDTEPDGVWFAHAEYSSEDDELLDWLTEIDEEEIPEAESAAMTASATHGELTPCPSCGHRSPVATKKDSPLEGETANGSSDHENESSVRRNLENDCKRSARSKCLTLGVKSRVAETSVYVSGDILPTGRQKYTFGSIEMSDDKELSLSAPPIQPAEHLHEVIPTSRHRKREETEPRNVIRRGEDSQQTYQGHLEAKRSLRSCETSQNRIGPYLGDHLRVLGEPPACETDWGGSGSGSVAARTSTRRRNSHQYAHSQIG